jgi:ATP-dependent HslUV protease subunit HslV
MSFRLAKLFFRMVKSYAVYTIEFFLTGQKLMSNIQGTTVVCVRRGNAVAIGSDGQVTLQNATILKHDAQKIRKLTDYQVLIGFAGSTADALTLVEQFEGILKNYQSNIRRAAIELAKKWRTDKILRRLDAMLAVANRDCSLLISGNGDVLEPSDGILAIGSGGMYARAASQALLKHTQLSAAQIVKESLLIAASICIYTNDKICIEELKIEGTDA